MYLNLDCHPESFGIYSSWYKHHTCFTIFMLTLKWSRYWALPFVVGGPSWTLTQKTHSRSNFLTKLGKYQDYFKTLLLTKETWKIMFGLENRGETLIFMWRHFDETLTILISHFFRFWCTKNFNWWLFCVKNKSNNIFQTKKLMFYSFKYFSQHFSYSSFSHSLCTGWRTIGVWIELHISK